MTPFSISLVYVSMPSISCKASYKGRRYGSTFVCKSPGRKPSFSPASTAGRVRMIFSTCLLLNAATARHTARYVLPVPAGPTPNTTVLFLTASTYCFCPTVLHLICLPREVTATTPSRTAAISPTLPSLASSMQYTIRLLSTLSPLPANFKSSASTSSPHATSFSSPSSCILTPST